MSSIDFLVKAMIQAPEALTSLNTLAAQINSAHAQCQQAYNNSLKFAHHAGDLLLEAKSQVAHGEWLPWVNANCNFSERTARVYMQVSRDWDKLPSESADSADLTIESALKLLTGKTDVVDAELVVEKDNPPLPPPPDKHSSNSSIREGSWGGASQPTQSAALSTTAPPPEFVVGDIAKVRSSGPEEFAGKSVEVVKVYDKVIIVFETLDNRTRSAAHSTELKPLQRCPNYILYKLAEEGLLPHDLALNFIRQVVDEKLELPSKLRKEALKLLK